jgi:hypothetical protein
MLPQEENFEWWLRNSFPGWLPAGHPFLMDRAFRELPTEDPIVEIGTFFGLSTNVMAHLLDRRALDIPIWNCDPWTYGDLENRIDPDQTITWGDYRDFVINAYITNSRFFSGHALPRSVAATSAEFFDRWRKDEMIVDLFGNEHQAGGPISFCYIDGAHDYENVRRDFTLCDEFLVRGGMILFDDSDPIWPDVHRCAREVVASGRYEIVDRNPNYLVRKLR